MIYTGHALHLLNAKRSGFPRRLLSQTRVCRSPRAMVSSDHAKRLESPDTAGHRASRVEYAPIFAYVHSALPGHQIRRCWMAKMGVGPLAGLQTQ